jgi:pyruvate carboxylase
MSGSVTSAGTYSTSWIPPNQNFISNNGSPLMTVPHNEEKIVLEKAATLEVKGTVVINGIDLEERLKTIEKVLQIPERDVIMEAKYPKLADLYQQYMHELERYKTWDRIKGNEDGTT